MSNVIGFQILDATPEEQEVLAVRAGAANVFYTTDEGEGDDAESTVTIAVTALGALGDWLAENRPGARVPLGIVKQTSIGALEIHDVEIEVGESTTSARVVSMLNRAMGTSA